jgi:S-DNA-T family DNA segregation ATPase FtsK/SpoIIIE
MSEDDYMDGKEKLSNILKIFEIKGEITGIIKGGRVTRYELQIDPTQKIKPIQNLATEIGTAFGVGNTVMIQPIYSKEYVVGIEIPNIEIEETATADTATVTTFAVGDTIDGKTVYADICDFPHLLVAGTTGSGKSVCLNSITTSLIQKALPEQVKIVLIDPKRVEMSAYKNVPHLLCEVITEPKKATIALRWLARQMGKRYSVLEEVGVKDVDSYNKADLGETFPKIVVIIDELADLMMMSENQRTGNHKTKNVILL